MDTTTLLRIDHALGRNPTSREVRLWNYFRSRDWYSIAEFPAWAVEYALQAHLSNAQRFELFYFLWANGCPLLLIREYLTLANVTSNYGNVIDHLWGDKQERHWDQMVRDSVKLWPEYLAKPYFDLVRRNVIRPAKNLQ